jgi:hypothetical protein
MNRLIATAAFHAPALIAVSGERASFLAQRHYGAAVGSPIFSTTTLSFPK